jgi:hypothetical protein
MDNLETQKTKMMNTTVPTKNKNKKQKQQKRQTNQE